MIDINNKKDYLIIFDFVFANAFLQIFLQYGEFSQLLLIIELFTFIFGVFSLFLFYRNLKEMLNNKSNIVVILFSIYACCVSLFSFNSSSTFSEGYSLLFSLYSIVLWPLIYLGLNTSKEIFNTEHIKKRLIFWTFVMIIPFGYLVFNSKQKWFGPVYLIYYSIFMIPLFILFLEKKEKIIFISLYLLGLFYVGKRGGILAIVFGFICYIICEYLTSDDKKKIMKKVIISFVSIITLFLVINQFANLNSVKFISRFSTVAEDGGSGRIDLWKRCIILIHNMPIKNLIFGNGMGGTFKLLGFHMVGAHNDILEVIIDYGLIGIIFYIIINIRWLYYGIRLVLNKSKYGSVIIFEFVMYVILGQISFMFWKSEVIIVYILAMEILVNLSGIERRTFF